MTVLWTDTDPKCIRHAGHPNYLVAARAAVRWRNPTEPIAAINAWLADPGIVLYTLFVIISWKYFGFHMVLYLAGLQQIPRELEEAASIDGASP